MIHFTLKCAREHRFESWFQSVTAFEKLMEAGMVSCSVCGSSEVEKALMAPRVHDSRSRTPVPDTPASPKPSAEETALADLKRRVEETSEYVGRDFAHEARGIHDGTAPARSIHGEARLDDARKLIEDGVPVAPLPFVPRRKTN